MSGDEGCPVQALKCGMESLKRECEDPAAHPELKAKCLQAGINIKDILVQDSTAISWTDAGRKKGTVCAVRQVDDCFNAYEESGDGALHPMKVVKVSLGNNTMKALCTGIKPENISVGTMESNAKKGISWGSRKHLEGVAAKFFMSRLIERLNKDGENVHELSFADKISRATAEEKRMAMSWLESLQDNISDKNIPLYVEFVVAIQPDAEKPHYISFHEDTYANAFTTGVMSLGAFQAHCLLPKARQGMFGIDDAESGTTRYLEGKAMVEKTVDVQDMPTGVDVKAILGDQDMVIADEKLSVFMNEDGDLLPCNIQGTMFGWTSAGVDIQGPTRGGKTRGGNFATTKSIRPPRAPSLPDFAVFDTEYKKSEKSIGPINLVGMEDYPDSAQDKLLMSPATMKVRIGQTVQKENGRPFTTKEVVTLLTRIVDNFLGMKELLAGVTDDPSLRDVNEVSVYNEEDATPHDTEMLKKNEALTGAMGSGEQGVVDPSLKFLFCGEDEQENNSSPKKKPCK